MIFYESSAKTGFNIEELFTASAKEISKKIENGFYDLNNDSCGIKQGLVSTTSENVKLKEGKVKSGKEKSKCC
jgi:hypothetical protein